MRLIFQGGMRIRPARSFRGRFVLPGDKSITHRAFLFGALANGISTVEGASTGDDCASTRRCLETLGTRFEDGGSTIRIHGGHPLVQPDAPLDCGNSGTTLRLLMGPYKTSCVEKSYYDFCGFNRCFIAHNLSVAKLNAL